MKKNLFKLGVTTMASAVLISTAFALPVLAKSDFDAMMDKVFITTTTRASAALVNDSEYPLTLTALPTGAVSLESGTVHVQGMAYPALTVQPVDPSDYTSSAVYVTSAFNKLTDEQAAPYVEMAKTQIKEAFGGELPDNADFTATTYSINDVNYVYVYCSLPDGVELAEGMAEHYTVTVSDVDVEKGTGNTQSVMAYGKNKISGIDELAKTAAEAFKDQLGIEITDEYSVDATVSVTGGETTVHFNWYDKEQRDAALDPLSSVAARFYDATLKGVDMKNGTGKITSLESGFLTMSFKGGAHESQYSDDELKMMENSARAFADKQGIQLGKVKQQLQIQNDQSRGSMILFESENDSTVRISVSEDGNILGYATMSEEISAVSIHISTAE